jgi:(p)ppGpp synthase/HD superfamily hydrolase
MLGARFEAGLIYAFELHRRQKRKGGDTPYFAHLMSVSGLVLENGGDEEQAIAALLHDAVEDQGGVATLAEIRRRFGERVARIVEGCTDAYTIPKPPWRKRKEAYLLHLKDEPGFVRLVSLADKVHNARSILTDLQTHGVSVFERFTGGKDGTLWYYRSLAESFHGDPATGLARELERVVGEIEKLATA